MEHGADYKAFREKYGRDVQHDFSASVSAIGFSDKAKEAILEGIEKNDAVVNYPDRHSLLLREAIAKYYRVNIIDKTACGCGACDLIYRICAAMKPRRVGIVEPAFSEYEKAAKLHGAEEILHIQTHKKNGYVIEEKDLLKIANFSKEPSALMFICSPANPTGAVTPYKSLALMIGEAEKKGTTVVLDACFADFDGESSAATERLVSEMAAGKWKNLIILSAFTKFYGLAGLRVGYAICSSEEVARRIEEAGEPWAVSALASRAAVASLSDSDFRAKQILITGQERAFMRQELEKLGVAEVWGRANFLMIRTRAILADTLGKQGIYIRNCADFYGLGAGYFRISLKSHEENLFLINALKNIYDGFNERSDGIKQAVPLTKQAVPLMVQGTMSNAGKSFLVAALCRIFKQDGYKVAPFKSQNMALNSFATSEGLEVGRAQAMQAEAAGVAVDVRMNPILLKPTSDTGSQVIVKGKSIGNMSARDYFKYKAELVPVVKECYESLARENDIIVIEGAGSPAEINLKSHDIVNMGLARMVDSPVLLAADIDRGGVFAQLAGTVALLDDEERERVKGLIINKFRGDKSLLDSGISEIEERTEKKVVGVVPMIKVSLDAEDSLATDFGGTKGSEKALRVAIVRLPYISNVTDFAPLEQDSRFSVKYCAQSEELWSFNPHLVILPGSKSTIADCAWLYEKELALTIHRLYDSGVLLLGICGGFQMLGTMVKDYECVESDKAEKIDGLCLLPMETRLKKEKTTKQTRLVIEGVTGAWSALNGAEVVGYEIHNGYSKELGSSVYMAQGSVFGTYTHGFFDTQGVLSKTAEAVAKRFGIDITAANNLEKTDLKDAQTRKEEEYDKLADEVRAALDMNEIYSIMGIK